MASQKPNMWIDALNRLYLSHNHRFVYLEQLEGGGYVTRKARRGGYPLPLVDTMLLSQVAGDRTYGVFANYNGKTPFMVFDLDFQGEWAECKRHCYAIQHALIDCGIPKRYIYVTDSGNKGLHIVIYFEEPVHYKVAKQIYRHALMRANLYEMRDKIEFRPTTGQGIKLPLGMHRATGRRMQFLIPWDLEKDMPDHRIPAIERMPSETLCNALERLGDGREGLTLSQGYVPARALQEAREVVRQAEAELLENTRSLEIYRLGSDTEYTIAHYERILKEGIKDSGTRHKLTYQLCLFLKTIYGFEQKESLQVLIEWLNKQPADLYTTPYRKALTDTKEIVADIYEKNRTLELGKKELTVTIRELEIILSAVNQNGKAYTPKQKSVLFALLMHGKRYASRDGTFYMTYKQMTEATGIASRRILKNLIADFTAMGLTAVHRANAARQGTYFKQPNIYSVLFAQKNTVTDKGNGSTVQDYTAETFTTVVRNHFTPKALRKMNLPRRQIVLFTA